MKTPRYMAWHEKNFPSLRSRSCEIRKEGIREEESLLSNFFKKLFDQLLVPGTIVFSG